MEYNSFLCSKLIYLLAMKRIAFLLCVISIALSCYAQNQTLDDYVSSVKENSCAPIDYIFNLFENSDIVVIGERDHRDTTQYELILDLLKDPRFAQEVGYVYTEVGCVNRTKDVNKLLCGRYKSDKAFNDALYTYLRNEDFNPLWDKYNRVQFLRGLYEINHNSKHKITLGLTDCNFSWKRIKTAEEYKNFDDSPACAYRDSTMCLHFSKMYAKQKLKNGKRKALVITNHPHALNATFEGSDYHRQGKWLKERYGNDNVKIVMLNWTEYTNSNDQQTSLVADGLWDAAFEVVDCQPFGMDIKGTPFGHTPYFNDRYGKMKWEDVADGVIYYRPCYETVLTIGIPGIVSADFEEEFMRRIKIYFEAMELSVPTLEEAKPAYDRFVSFPGTYPQSPDSVRESIRKLLAE